jgi:hypothetical protein
VKNEEILKYMHRWRPDEEVIRKTKAAIEARKKKKKGERK